MEQEKTYLLITVIASSVVVVFMVVAVIDLLYLFRKRKRASDLALREKQSKIDKLLKDQEAESVNAMLKGQGEERKRISQELHDRLGSVLFTAKLHYKQLGKSLEILQENQRNSYQHVTTLLDEAVNEVRRISHDLYESSMSKFGFKTALNQLISAIAHGNEVEFKVNDTNFDYSKLQPNELELYRIIQELLSNTLKHAKASIITLTFKVESNQIIFTYQDNGLGFKLNQNGSTNGIGLINIKSRVSAMHGHIVWDSNLVHGMKCDIILDTTHD